MGALFSCPIMDISCVWMRLAWFDSNMYGSCSITSLCLSACKLRTSVIQVAITICVVGVLVHGKWLLASRSSLWTCCRGRFHNFYEILSNLLSFCAKNSYLRWGFSSVHKGHSNYFVKIFFNISIFQHFSLEHFITFNIIVSILLKFLVYIFFNCGILWRTLYAWWENIHNFFHFHVLYLWIVHCFWSLMHENYSLFHATDNDMLSHPLKLQIQFFSFKSSCATLISLVKFAFGMGSSFCDGW